MQKIISTLFLCFLFTVSNAQVITDGLIGYWPFNGDAVDESSNSNDGKVTGATLVNDRFGNSKSAYFFDGDSDYVDCGNHKSLFVSTNTTNFWFKYNQDTNQIQTLVNDANSISGEWGVTYNFHPGADGLQAVLTGGTNDAWIAARVGKSYADDKWHMFTSVYSAKDNTFRVFIDGCYVIGKTHERYGFTTGKDSLQHNGNDHWIFGAHSQYFSSTNNAGPRYYHGTLDDVFLYDRPLTDCEVMKLYAGEIFVDTIEQYVTVYDTVYETITDTVYETITDTVYETITDTLFETITDTLYETIRDTIYENIRDTTFITFRDTFYHYDTLYTSVTDTMYIKLEDPGGSGKSCDIRLFPNPTDHVLYIDSRNGCDLTDYTIKVIDDIGQVVITTTIQSKLFSIDLDALVANGFYIFEIRDPSNGLIKRKVIVLY